MPTAGLEPNLRKTIRRTPSPALLLMIMISDCYSMIRAASHVARVALSMSISHAHTTNDNEGKLTLCVLLSDVMLGGSNLVVWDVRCKEQGHLIRNESLFTLISFQGLCKDVCFRSHLATCQRTPAPETPETWCLRKLTLHCMRRKRHAGEMLHLRDDSRPNDSDAQCISEPGGDIAVEGVGSNERDLQRVEGGLAQGCGDMPPHLPMEQSKINQKHKCLPAALRRPDASPPSWTSVLSSSCGRSLGKQGAPGVRDTASQSQ